MHMRGSRNLEHALVPFLTVSMLASCLETDILVVYEQKEALTRKRGRLPFTKTISSSSSSRSKPTTPTHSKPSDSKEEAFWNTPGAPGRILQFKNENGGMHESEMLLTDERMDVELGDVTGSFATPLPRARSRTRVGASGLGGGMLGEEDGSEEGEEGNDTVSPDEVVNGMV